MNVTNPSQPSPAAPQQAGSPTGDAASRPENPQEAAKQFEKVFAKQFVQVMTKQMFSSGLSGEDGAQWMQTQRRRQRSTMTNVLTDHLVDSDMIGLRDRLMRQWGVEPGDEAMPSSAQTAQELKEIPAHHSASPPLLQSSHSDGLNTVLRADSE